MFLRQIKLKTTEKTLIDTIFNPFKTLINKFNTMTPQEKEIIYLPIETTKDTFTIGNCGKFGEAKKHINKTEAIYLYVELHKWIFAEENKQTENIYLNRLKEQYKETFKGSMDDKLLRKRQYLSVRLFCLDTQLVSFNDIEVMEKSVF